MHVTLLYGVVWWCIAVGDNVVRCSVLYCMVLGGAVACWVVFMYVKYCIVWLCIKC